MLEAATHGRCCSLAQGKRELRYSVPGQRGLALLLVFGLVAAGAAEVGHAAAPGPLSQPPSCPGPALRVESLAGGLWWVPAAGLDTDDVNRGHVYNLIVAEHAGGLWLVGSGPSPVFGRALRCQLQARLGLPVVAVANPVARAEWVLGNGGFIGLDIWAPQAVAAAMATQCPGCVTRVRARLGPTVAAADLGDDPVRLPAQTLAGTEGHWGPYRWRLVARGGGHWTTVWSWRVPAPDSAGSAMAFTFAPGLLGGEAQPDTHEAELARLPGLLSQLLQQAVAGERWLPEHGGPLAAAAVSAQQRYWQALVSRAQAGVARGETLPPAETSSPAGWPAGWERHPRHALAWQRAWRQAEDSVMQLR